MIPHLEWLGFPLVVLLMFLLLRCVKKDIERDAKARRERDIT